jgi:hypothetical protein
MRDVKLMRWEGFSMSHHDASTEIFQPTAPPADELFGAGAVAVGPPGSRGQPVGGVGVAGGGDDQGVGEQQRSVDHEAVDCE